MKTTFQKALKASMPVILGYLPAGFGFGLLAATEGNLNLGLATAMSVFIYAGAGQYLAVGFFANNLGLLQMGMLTFLINSKHLFYGLSLLEEFKQFKRSRLYMIFSLTDETYAVLTGTKVPENTDPKYFMLFVSVINQVSWITGTILGALFGSVFTFNAKGIDFALVSLFLVILVDQLNNFKTKLPFIIGACSGLAAMFLGKSNMLLLGAIFAVALLFLLKKRVTANEH